MNPIEIEDSIRAPDATGLKTRGDHVPYPMNQTTPETWMKEAREIAAQCWCDEETKDDGGRHDSVLCAKVPQLVAKLAQTFAPEGSLTALTKRLTRPLACLDLETTGTDIVLDRIVSIAVFTLSPSGETREFKRLVNPGMPIPKQASDIHGITDAMVKDAPYFSAIVREVKPEIQGCDLCGFNLRKFDIPLLAEEFNRAQFTLNLNGVKVIDASDIFRKKEPRDLSAAVKKYCGREHESAHDALGDVKATLDVLNGQIEAYDDLRVMDLTQLTDFACAEEFDGKPATRVDLAGHFIRSADGAVRFTAMKVRGKRVQDDLGYANWMLRNSFPENTKAVIRRIIETESDLPWDGQARRRS